MAYVENVRRRRRSKASKLAKRITKVVMDDMLDRRGFRQTWDGCDPDTQNEIVNSLEKLVDAELTVEHRIPYRPYLNIHPSEHLKGELKSRGYMWRKFATHIGLGKIDIGRFKAFFDGDNPLDADLAWRLSKALDTSPEYWMRLQNDYDLWPLRTGKINHIKQLPKRRRKK